MNFLVLKIESNGQANYLSTVKNFDYLKWLIFVFMKHFKANYNFFISHK